MPYFLMSLQTDAEYLDIYHRSYTPSNRNYTNSKVYQPPVGEDYPDSVDWRTKGAVGSVKNQVLTVYYNVLLLSIFLYFVGSVRCKLCF